MNFEFNWQILLVTVLVQLLGYFVYSMVGMPFEKQGVVVLEQYNSSQEMDVFLLYYTDKDRIEDISVALNEFQKQYPEYVIVQYQKVVKTRLNRTFEVLVIYAQPKK